MFLPISLSLLMGVMVAPGRPWRQRQSEAGRSPGATPSRRRHVQQAREGAAADVVDARIDDALALDLDQDRRIEGRAVELAQHQREIGALRVPGGLEIGTKLDLRRAVRSAHRELPAPVARLAFMPLGEL